MTATLPGVSPRPSATSSPKAPSKKRGDDGALHFLERRDAAGELQVLLGLDKQLIELPRGGVQLGVTRQRVHALIPFVHAAGAGLRAWFLTGATERESAMLALARRITRTGGAQADTELERARKAGLTDAQLVEVAAHVASKLFTNAVGIMSQVKVDLPAQPNLPTP